MNRFEFTKGSTGKPLRIECSDADGVVDISGATVVFYYTIGSTRYSKAVPVTDGPNGVALAYWVSGDFTPWTPGNYRCQVHVTFPSGKIRYFPDEGKFGVMTIREAL